MFSNHCLCHNISDLLVRDDLREQLRRRGDLGQRRGLPPHRRACDEPRSRSTPPLAHVQLRTLQLLRTVCVRCKKRFIFVTLKPSRHTSDFDTTYLDITVKRYYNNLIIFSHRFLCQPRKALEKIQCKVHYIFLRVYLGWPIETHDT